MLLALPGLAEASAGDLVPSIHRWPSRWRRYSGGLPAAPKRREGG
jgi:hypothetical protein